MGNNGTTTSATRAVIDRLLAATNDHDLEGLVGCFAPAYVNATPVHPARGFVGSDQIRRNWTQIFAAVPDLVAQITARTEDGGTAWTEWEMSGSRRDGTPHLMRGVVVFTTSGDQISSARFYLEPVDSSRGDVNAALTAQLTGQARP